jgi:membrane protein YqaA with SNARE-associated domain
MYLSLLWNSFSASIIFLLHNECVLYAMRAFGGHDMTLPVVIAVLGATVGQFFFYLLGFYLNMMWLRNPVGLSEEQYNQLQNMTARYGVWALLLFMIPVYPVLPLIAGFFRTPLKYVFPLLTVAMLLQRLWGLHVLDGTLAKMAGV